MTPDSTVPSDTDRPGFEPRHPNAVPARCDGCPAPARWTRGGSRYCDEHARLTAAPRPATNRRGKAAPLSDEELTLYGELIDTTPGTGSVLTWTAEARLLTEVQRARAEVQQLQGRLDTAEGQLAKAREQNLWIQKQLDIAEKTIRHAAHTAICEAETPLAYCIESHGRCARAAVRALGLGEGDGQ